MRLLKLVPDNTNINFLRWRSIAFAISTLLILASIALIAVKGLNFGVDFAGGQTVRVHFPAPSESAQQFLPHLGTAGPFFRRPECVQRAQFRRRFRRRPDRPGALSAAAADRAA